MKNNIYSIIFIFVVLSVSRIFSQEAFAPVATIPEGLEKDSDPAISMLIQSIKAVNVPVKSTVGISAYAGSILIQTNQGSADYLPSLRLLSTDSLKQVYSYYTAELKDWSHEEFYGMYTLWKGKKEDSMMGIAPTINIESAKDDDKKVLPDAQTLISIWYKPVN
jgi:hypothetical protein